MEKIIVRYSIFLKLSLKNKMMWLYVLLMVCVALLFSKVVISDNDNTTVMLYGESTEAEQVIMRLTASESVFSFVEAETEYDLEEKVRSGAAECGFVFHDGFEKNFSDGKKGGIDFATSPFTVKGIAAKETVFAAIMEIYAGDLIGNEAGNIFKDKDGGLERTMQYYNNIVHSDEVFNVKYEKIDGVATQNIRHLANRFFPVHGIITFILLSYGLILENENRFGKYRSFGKAFTSTERNVLFVEKRFATLTVPILAGFITARVLEASFPIMNDILYFAILLPIIVVFVSIFSILFKREESYICWSLFVLFAVLIGGMVFTL